MFFYHQKGSERFSTHGRALIDILSTVELETVLKKIVKTFILTEEL